MLCKLHYTLPSQREFGPPVVSRFHCTNHVSYIKKEALIKTEWHFTQSQPLLHQIFKEPSIFFSYKKKKKQIKTTKGLHTVSSPRLLQLFPVSPSRKEPRLAWESRLPSLPKQIGQWNSLGKKSYSWYLRLRELFYFRCVTSSVWPSFQTVFLRLYGR